MYGRGLSNYLTKFKQKYLFIKPNLLTATWRPASLTNLAIVIISMCSGGPVWLIRTLAPSRSEEQNK